MKVFLVGQSEYIYKNKIFDFYCLMSYHYLTPKRSKVIHEFRDFILDSGIFTYLSAKSKVKTDIDWYEYARKYADFVKRYAIRNYVEIDIDRFVGLAEVERLREYLNKTVGWKCMPVWHIDRGWDKWIEICHDYPYVCFGAFITDGLAKNKYHYIPQFLNEARRHGTKVHGLGFTSMAGLRRYKFYSVDSSTWTIGNRYGSVFRFRNGAIEVTKKGAGQRIGDQGALAVHNLTEWIKFSNYAERNL